MTDVLSSSTAALSLNNNAPNGRVAEAAASSSSQGAEKDWKTALKLPPKDMRFKTKASGTY